MAKAEYTPPPYVVYDEDHGNTIQIHSEGQLPGRNPCIVHWTGFDHNTFSPRTNLANAEFIARCCTTHADLLAACQAVVDNWEHGDLAAAVRLCEAAIEQAVQP